jgi:hypothetical protein
MRPGRHVVRARTEKAPVNARDSTFALASSATTALRLRLRRFLPLFAV